MTTNPRVPINPPPPDAPLGSSSYPGSTNTSSPVPPAAPKSVWQRWLAHIALWLFVLFCTGIGMWLILLPWSLQWTDNPLLWTHPGLRMFLSYGFVRGFCSGLGILDLWIGVREATHYYEKLAILR